MINKYTLKFRDSKIEDKYQEYQNFTTRKPLVFQLFCLSFFWNMTDLIQMLIQNELHNINVQSILQDYLPQLIMLTLFLGTYFFKPNYTKWVILMQNHFFVYLYWNQHLWLFYCQATFYTYLIIGTQFILLMSSEFLEIVYQVLLFTSVYFTQMMLETPPFNYSFFTTTILSVFVFLYNFYNHCSKIREQFKLSFIDNQWEQIFISLNNQPYLIFDYDELHLSFNFRYQQKYDEKIKDSSSLKEYLRFTKSQDNKLTLEQYVYGKLNSQNNIIKQNLEVQYGKQSRKNNTIKYSIFQGVKPIIVFEYSEKEITEQCNLKCYSKDFESSYHSKYLIFMKLAKKLIFSSRKRFLINLLRFKRLCIFENFEQFLNFYYYKKKDLPVKSIQFERLIIQLARLYPHIKITSNYQLVGSIVNSKQLISIVLIGIFEKILSREVTLILITQKDRNASMTIKSYFNVKSFQKLKEIISNQSKLIPTVIIDSFSITLILTDNDIVESTCRKAQNSDLTQERVSSYCSYSNQISQRQQIKKGPKQIKQAAQYDE